MKLKDLESVFVHELRDLYSAEKQLTKALPKMAKAASHAELKHCFESHLDETEHHVERLERAFELLGLKARAEKCLAMEGLIGEGKHYLEAEAEPDVRDAALICAAQRIEHYETAGYGCVTTFARQLGHEEVGRLLHETLEEEKAADKKLTDIAESRVNQEAMAH